MSFINLINFSHQDCLILQQNWVYIKRKNIFHQQRSKNNANLVCFNALPYWEMLYEEQNIQWKHYINVLKLLTKFTTQHKTIICFELIVFLLKSEDVFNLSAATKNLRKITPFNYKFSRSTLTISVTSINLFYCKT